MKKRSLIITVAIFLVFSLILMACGGTQSTQSNQNNPSSTSKNEQVRTIKLAHYFAAEHPQNIALRDKFKAIVEEKSGGKLQIQIYENSKLGKEAEINGVVNGTIEMGVAGLTLSRSLPIVGVPEWPFLFESYDHANKVLNGPIGDEITKDLVNKTGIRNLVWSANGFRVVSSNKLIKSMEDFKGFRLRMPNVPTYIKVGQSWGSNVQPMDISEIFTALEQKVIDGQENPYATLKASGWYEVQKNVLQTYHLFSPNMFVVNEKFWQTLTPDQQKIIQEAAKAYSDFEWKLLQDQEQEDKKFLQDKGLVITVPDDKLKNQLREASLPIYEEFYKQYDWAKNLVERIRKEAK